MASEIPSRWHDGALGELFEPMEPKFMIEDLDPQPSDLVRASPHLMSCLTYGMKVEEAERQAQRAFALGEAFASIPWHAERAAKDPDYWIHLYGSRINW